jgi:prophage regulatory protein
MTSSNEIDRIIDRNELKKLIPFSVTHILRLEAQGKFPARIRLGASRVGWSLLEIQEWIAERKDARGDANYQVGA